MYVNNIPYIDPMGFGVYILGTGSPTIWCQMYRVNFEGISFKKDISCHPMTLVCETQEIFAIY